MPSNTPFNKKKPRGRDRGDEQAMVKAAAWAWYQHGSGSEGKQVCEFEVAMNRQAPRPSRYKLEAMTIMEGTKKGASQTPSPIHGTISSLLDTYEIVRISKQLDYLIESSSNPFLEELYVKDVLQRQESWRSDSGSSNSDTSSMKKRMDMKFLKGFLLRPAIVCGTRRDVDTRALVSIRRQRPEGHVRVVK